MQFDTGTKLRLMEQGAADRGGGVRNLHMRHLDSTEQPLRRYVPIRYLEKPRWHPPDKVFVEETKICQSWKAEWLWMRHYSERVGEWPGLKHHALLIHYGDTRRQFVYKYFAMENRSVFAKGISWADSDNLEVTNEGDLDTILAMVPDRFFRHAVNTCHKNIWRDEHPRK